jgi:hypothetical protein
VPVAQLQPGQERLGAAREERTHGEQQHLIEQLALVGARVALPARRRHRRLVPRGHDRFDLPVARQPLNTVVIGQLERLEAAQNIGGLPNHQAEIAPVDRDLFELQDRTGLLVVGLAPIERRGRQRDSCLHASLCAEQLDLHVGRRRQIGLRVLELSQLSDLARFGARGPLGGSIRRRICLRICHFTIVTQWS